MKYRCPYCGEPAFTTAEKMGIHVGGVGKYSAAQTPCCPHCKNVARRTLFGGAWGGVSAALILLAMALFVPSLFQWGVSAQSNYMSTLFVAALLLLVGGYFAIHYFWVYFDKTAYEAAQDATFTLTVSASRRLSLRTGDIYVCHFPGRESWDVPRIIAMVQGVKKTEGGYTVTLRVIRADNMDLPAVDERVRVITDHGADVEGIVISVTPKKER